MQAKLVNQLGASGIGLVFKDGIVLAAERKSQSKLIEKMGFDKIVEVSSTDRRSRELFGVWTDI